MRPRGIDEGHPVSGTRTRVGSLKPEVKPLEAEREILANRVFAREADIAELGGEVTDLEGTVEAEERRHQRVIDRYERLIEKREAAKRELRGERYPEQPTASRTRVVGGGGVDAGQAPGSGRVRSGGTPTVASA
ncbi:hypothetical protein [Halobellus ruber]|uniref:Uncharacterized protein n=1 Tax=Halobellus ruber TaxID=2761102 RepID=A0A7J9SMW1_9EURY|nr:hypothetical protein [Halobellus ruber]MBB6647932.1 hypothetical protein [Halobellus ruber]